MKQLFLEPWTLTLDTLEALLSRKGWAGLAAAFAAMVLFWFLYVPLHELLHAAGCALSGGEVRELALQPRYGAGLLKEIFPFVVPGSGYAGRLTGFSVPGRFSYLLVDLFPYLPSLFGVALIRLAGRRSRPALFGPAVLLAFMPVIAVPGDYHEAVSLFTSPLLETLAPGTPAGLLVSDDAVKLFLELRETGRLTAATLAVFAGGLFLSVLLAAATLALEAGIARILPGGRPGTGKLLDKDAPKR
jgi:hypothetical protein